MFGTKLTFSRKENLRPMLKRSLGAMGSGMDIQGNFCSFFYSASVGQPSFPLP